jgi:plastocyanin
MHAVSGGATAVIVVVMIIAVGVAFLYVSRPASTSASNIPTQHDSFTSPSAGATPSTTTSTTTTLKPNAVQIVIPSGDGENDDGATTFNPHATTVVIGVNNTVTWINQDFIVHNALSVSGYFFSGDLSHGQTYSFTFTRAGTYPFYCSYYPIMNGVITVENP